MFDGPLLLAVAGLAALASGAIEVSPQDPTERDLITLKVPRSFTEDCLWQAAPTVQREQAKISVILNLSGQPHCDQVLVDRVFDIVIGPFPRGSYTLFVRWADSHVDHSLPMTIAPAR